MIKYAMIITLNPLYRPSSCIKRCLEGNKLADHSNVVGALRVGPDNNKEIISIHWHISFIQDLEAKHSPSRWCGRDRQGTGSCLTKYLLWWWITLLRPVAVVYGMQNYLVNSMATHYSKVTKTVLKTLWLKRLLIYLICVELHIILIATT